MLSNVEAKRAFEEPARWTTRGFSKLLVFPLFFDGFWPILAVWECILGPIWEHLGPPFGRFEATLSKVVAKQAVEGFTEALWGHFEPIWWHLEAVLGPF